MLLLLRGYLRSKPRALGVTADRIEVRGCVAINTSPPDLPSASSAAPITHQASRSVKLVLAVRAHCRGLWIHLRTEITQANQWLGFAGIFKCHARFGAVLGAKVFVLG